MNCWRGFPGTPALYLRPWLSVWIHNSFTQVPLQSQLRIHPRQSIRPKVVPWGPHIILKCCQDVPEDHRAREDIPEGGGHPPGLELRAGPSWSELPQLPHRSNPVTTTSEMCGFSSFLWCSPGTAPHLRQASHLNILFRESPGAAVSWSGHSGARGPQAGSAWELTSLEPGRPSPAPHHSDISTLCSCAGRTP